MGTSAPVRRTHDIPLTEQPPQILPLPAPDPSRIVTPMIPVRQPDRVPVRREIVWQ